MPAIHMHHSPLLCQCPQCAAYTSPACQSTGVWACLDRTTCVQIIRQVALPWQKRRDICVCKAAPRAGAELPALPNLVHLNLIHCGAVTDDGLAAVAGGFPQLQTLQLKTPWITDAGMGHLSALSSLERLDLVDCELVQGPGLAQLVVGQARLVVSCMTSMLCSCVYPSMQASCLVSSGT